MTSLEVVLVAVFGGAGAVCRTLLSLRLNPDLSQAPALPWGTILANLLGCLLLGLLAGLTAASPRIPPALRLPLMSGFLGGFTTFSTFSIEALRLAQQGAWGLAAADVVLQVGGGLLAAALGLLLAHALTP